MYVFCYQHVLADVWVVKSSELGSNEQQYHCRTHLGHLLNPGDSVLGFDLRTSNVNDTHLEKMKAEKIPDIILVKKLYADSSKRWRRRQWRLKHLDVGDGLDTDRGNRDYTEFLEDLEEDQLYREHVNIYRDVKQQTAVDTEDTDDDDAPQITLAEMLDDLHISPDVDMEDTG